jgi:hypothetical protein
MKTSRFYYITFTVTVADPAVFTSTDHELYEGDTIWFETTGALPTGLSIHTTYYVVLNGLTASTFQISTSRYGDPIVTTGTQSGTHTWIKTNRARLTPVYEADK